MVSSVPEQAGVCHTLLHNSESRFSLDETILHLQTKKSMNIM